MNFENFVATVAGNIWLHGIIFLFVITLVVLVHEAGHYLVARVFNIKIESFSIGLGREVLGRTDKNGCRWSLRLIPFGGFIRMFGSHHSDLPLALSANDRRHAFCERPVYARILVALAGPIFNFIFGFLLLICLYTTIGRPAPEPYVAALEVNSPAQKAGIEIGDVVYSINGQKMSAVEDVKSFVADKIDRDVLVEVKRQDKYLSFHMKPEELVEIDSYGYKTRRGILGVIWPNYGLNIKEIYDLNGKHVAGNINLVREDLVKNFDRSVEIKFGDVSPKLITIFVSAKLNGALKDPKNKDHNTLTIGPRPMESIKRAGFKAAIKESSQILYKDINLTYGAIVQVVAGKKNTSELGGVVKISQMTAKMAGQGLFIFLSFIALLSVSVGAVNLLPIPGLDGGNLLFYIAEKIKGSPVSAAARAYVYGFSLIFLIIAIVAINAGDIGGLF